MGRQRKKVLIKKYDGTYKKVDKIYFNSIKKDFKLVENKKEKYKVNSYIEVYERKI